MLFIGKRRLSFLNMILIIVLLCLIYYTWYCLVSVFITELDLTNIKEIIASTKSEQRYETSEKQRKHKTKEVLHLIRKVQTIAPVVQDLKNIKRILLITTFRSGSTFLGDLLQHSDPLTYYHYEPLHYISFDTRIGIRQVVEANEVIKNLFQCNFEQIPRFMNYIQDPNHFFMINNNKFLFDICLNTSSNITRCSDIKVFREACHRSRIQIMKVTRLHMKDVSKLDLPPGTKIVYLQRDPRAIYNSRKSQNWCRKEVCSNITALCRERRNDLFTLKVLHNPNVKIVRFEDLALNPIKDSQRIFHELDLNFTKDVETFLETHTTRVDTFTKTHTNNFQINIDPFSTTRNSSSVVSSWKKQLTNEEILQLEENCKDVLTDLNYELINK